MVSHIEVFFRRLRRFFSRSEWTIRLLRLSKLERSSAQHGLVMVQIDGLSFTQLDKALKDGHAPFLRSLQRKEHYVLHSLYSGLPSNTPAVQGELFYGVKGCVPAFSFMDRKTGRAVKMNETAYVEGFEARLKEKGPGLLAGGSSYSNIFAGGAQEAHCCFGQMGWPGVAHAINPLVFPFLVILYIDIFIRTFILLVVEFFLAVPECLRGTLKGRLFLRELEMVWLRTLVCVALREFIVAGACMDIVRGLPVIHLNFLGYDEQAHCRGPSSRFAHWSMRGIDDAIRRVHHVVKGSFCQQYDLWVYSDHGQEKTTPYLVRYGITVEEAVKKLFEGGPTALVTAMGPLGHIYVDKKLEREDSDAYARKLVSEVKIPLVLTKGPAQEISAWTPRGVFMFPQQAEEVFGKDHPFLEEIEQDLQRVCGHPDAGEFVIAGWSKGEEAISFPLEYGAHAAMGSEETNAFALLPVDAPLGPRDKDHLRALDLRTAALRFLNKEDPDIFSIVRSSAPSKSIRLMSYNVHGCRGMDGLISTDRIARVIARHDPDIIALQELDVGRARSGGMNQAEKIAKRLEMQYHFHPAFRWKDEQYGNAILSRYPMALMKMDALPQWTGKKGTEPRGALWVSVDIRGIKVQALTTHLSLWPQERLLQVDALLSEQWLGHPDCHGPVVLCGDFNAAPGSPACSRLCGRLKDSQTALAGHRPRRTWLGRYPLAQIDHIFIDREFQVHAITVPRAALEKTASDHLPLIAEMSCSYFSALSNYGRNM